MVNRHFGVTQGQFRGDLLGKMDNFLKILPELWKCEFSIGGFILLFH